MACCAGDQRAYSNSLAGVEVTLAPHDEQVGCPNSLFLGLVRRKEATGDNTCRHRPNLLCQHKLASMFSRCDVHYAVDRSLCATGGRLPVGSLPCGQVL